MESMKIFYEKFHSIINNSVKSVLLENSESSETSSPRKENWSSQGENNLSCSYCQVEFTEAQQHREHYKLDWHRYNLKQSLLAKLPVSEDDFYQKNGNDDLSSISGSSDSEKEDTLDTFATAQGKIFLQNANGQVFSIYRCLVLDRKEETSDTILSQRLQDCSISNQQWAIFMLGGGHFAGCIFKGDEIILHKTFHCYTVRAGQGGSQSSRDNKGGGSQPKSAGASLRRYNEQALSQHVKGIVEAWKPEIAKCSLIVYRASGPYNRSVLFGGTGAILDRSDARLRTIPFSTRRATFTEIKRVHSILTTAQVYDSLDVATEYFSKEKSPENLQKRNKLRTNSINRAKSREIVERPLPGIISKSNSSSEGDLRKIPKNISKNSEESESAISDSGLQLQESELEINFSNLEEFGDSLTPEQRKKPHKKKKPQKSKSKKLREAEERKKKEILEVLFKGNLVKFKELLENFVKTDLENLENTENIEKVGKQTEKPDEKTLKTGYINKILDDKGNRVVHIVALNEHIEIMEYLLENDVDLCVKNNNQQTAYTCTQSRDIREVLKEFARDNPEKFNYNKAQIPLNTLSNDEQAEKKKALRKVKKEKVKEKRKEDIIKKKEEQEMDRFRQLTDREKRALAAERRILDQSGKVIARCFLCAADISGKVPFEYLGNRFCTIDCLKAHRMKGPIILS